MESEEVLWQDQLQYISKNHLVQKYYDVPSETKQGK